MSVEVQPTSKARRCYYNFLSFAAEGLECTNLTIHAVEVRGQKVIKQRQFSVSPALAKDLCARIGKMSLEDIKVYLVL